MSTRSKIVFFSSIIGAAIIIPAVHYMQAEQRETIRQGPIKDYARRNRKLTAEQEFRVNEYEEQKMLREHFSADQEVTSVDEIKKGKSDGERRTGGS